MMEWKEIIGDRRPQLFPLNFVSYFWKPFRQHAILSCAARVLPNTLIQFKPFDFTHFIIVPGKIKWKIQFIFHFVIKKIKI